MMAEIHVQRSDFAKATAVPRALAPAPGQALFRVEQFAITANNVTYATYGVGMAYWDFFPAPEGFGIVPVWGFGVVEESRVEGLAPGQRFYGYWPMASHALLTPGRISPRGFTDMAPHRQKLAAVYNGYVPASEAFGAEPVQALFRPLYTTAFVLDLMLQASPATLLVLTSASSKTALGLAQAAKGRMRVVGLTSDANRGFVEATGYYDLVLGYDEVARLADEAGQAALVDFSGNGKVRLAVHETLGARLIESHIVGDTHWDVANAAALPGVEAKLFFAPSVIAERIGQWGADGFEARLAAAWGAFIATLDWLKIVDAKGPEAVIAQWQAMVGGRIDPAVGVVAAV